MNCVINPCLFTCVNGDTFVNTEQFEYLCKHYLQKKTNGDKMAE